VSDIKYSPMIFEDRFINLLSIRSLFDSRIIINRITVANLDALILDKLENASYEENNDLDTLSLIFDIMTDK
jgi:hypothetical protein